MEWGGNIYFSHGESNARGVAILTPKGFEIGKKIIRDQEGRWLICTIKQENIEIALCNVYGPNNDSTSFYRDLATNLQECAHFKILMGDFNTVLDTSIDRYNSTHNNERAKLELKSIMEENLLRDVWRERNPDKLLLSWKKFKPRLCGSRIDNALLSGGMDHWVENVMYLSAFMTDHMAMFVTVNIK